MVFEKTLTDVVKGIRASKRDTALFISSCIAEIKNEINSTDIHVKANALQKLTFLQMLGYNMSWASFASIEVMSSPRFAHKRVGYLAASQGFTQDTEVILLTTNLFKKELRGAAGAGGSGSASAYEAGLAVNCLSNIVTEDLARELLPELTNLTSHPQPYLRKKAVLCLFKLFVKYPQGLRLTFSKVQQCLDDVSPSVVSCAVNVVTELSDKNPKNYLPLAPAFFGLLTGSSNNWMLIKVIKLLGSLVPEEPRLARKLLEPLANIVRGTQAKSLLYEAVYTITLCLPYCRKADGSMPPSVPQIVTLCAEVLRSFVEDSDQNLKYLGLVGFGSLMSSHPRVLSAPDYRPLILACLSDEDVTIRTRALDLLTGMATRKNLVELVTQLLRHVDYAAGKYKCDLVAKIVEICSADRYALLQDFSWYVDVLVRLGRTRGIERHGALVAGQAVDVALRVLPARSYAVRRMAGLLTSVGRGMRRAMVDASAAAAAAAGGLGGSNPGGGDGHVLPEMLPAAAWVVGEYSCLIWEAAVMENGGNDDDGSTGRKRGWTYDSSSKGVYHALIQALVAPSLVGTLDASAQAAYVQASVKVFAAASGASKGECSDAELESCVRTLAEHLPVFMESTECEVRERACTLYQLLDSLDLLPTSLALSGLGVPGLAPLQRNSDDSSASSSEDEAASSTQDDLLGFGMTAPPSPGKNNEKKKNSKAASALLGSLAIDGAGGGAPLGTIAPRCRSAAKTLSYLLIPEPMKPVSVKAQRKIRRAPPPGLRVDLDAPPNLSAFASLIDSERAQRPSHVGIESVSFTGQRPPSSMIGRGSVGAIGADTAGTADMSVLDRASFQHTGGATLGDNSGARQQQARLGDPFYLNSVPVETDVFGAEGGSPRAETASPASPGRFGAIQLLDSDNDGSDTGGKKKKHRKKEKKNKKKSSSEVLGAADFAALSGHEAAKSSSSKLVIESDDDEEEYDNIRIGAIASQRSKNLKKGSSQAKEFAGLAKVDLTAPLRDDEVMPKNEHYVVPERTQALSAPQEEGFEGSKKHKKKKSKGEKKKKKGKQEEVSSDQAGGGDVTADLLGFDGIFGESSSVSGPAIAARSGNAATAAPVGGAAAISSAFDDLLSLEPIPPPSLGGAEPAATSDSLADATLLGMSALVPPPSTFSKKKERSKKSNKRPWQRAALKDSQGIGSGWDSIALYFRTSTRNQDGGPPSATVALKVVSEGSSFQNLQAVFDGGVSPTLFLGNVSSGGFVESSGKAGPFNYAQDASSASEIRGVLNAAGGATVPFKMALPSTAFLEPVSGITQDAMMAELSSGRRWASHSAKIELSSLMNISVVKAALQSFLNADEVQGGDDRSGAVAAKCPQSGAQIRVLVKVKSSADGTVVAKIDIKATDEKIGKAIASDLKKVVF